MEPLRLDDAQLVRQPDHRQSISTGSSVSSSSLRTPSLHVASEDSGLSSDPCRPPPPPPPPLFGQYPPTSAFHSGPVSSASEASSPRPVSAPTGSSVQIRQPGQNVANRAIGTAFPFNPLDLSRRSNVLAACVPCKKAHLGCDTARPCKRCINLGKESSCKDVPHKKRGRPKQAKQPLSEPYSRAPRPLTSCLGSFPIPAPYSARGSMSSAASSTSSAPGRIVTDYRSASSQAPCGLLSAPTAPMTGHSQRPSSPPADGTDLFELFTTVDFKIVRTTPAVHHLTGFHSYEFLNLPLADFLHPHDAQLVYADRSRLVSASPWEHTTIRDTAIAVNQLTPHELLSPAAGMTEPYPNQNVRFRKASGECAWFNLRLHVGGGLGADIRQDAHIDKMYFVVSLLYLDQDLVSQSFSPLSPLGAMYCMPHPPAIRRAGPTAPPSLSHPAQADRSAARMAGPMLDMISQYPSSSPLFIGSGTHHGTHSHSRENGRPRGLDRRRALGVDSPLDAADPADTISPIGTQVILRSPQPALAVEEQCPTGTHSSYLDCEVGRSNVEQLSGPTRAPIGLAGITNGPSWVPQEHHQTASISASYPQYPPPDPDGAESSDGGRTRRISGRSDHSGRAWEL